jgi:hypothetical protein
MRMSFFCSRSPSSVLEGGKAKAAAFIARKLPPLIRLITVFISRDRAKRRVTLAKGVWGRGSERERERERKRERERAKEHRGDFLK